MRQQRPLVFACAGETLVGMLLAPAAGLDAVGTAVLIVAGGPQYRAGSHRQFVHTGRALADAGHAVLTFDVRGMGDSSGEQRSFEAMSDDIGAAIDALMAAVPRARRLVLLGLCDGASAALLYLHERRDPRVDALCLLNPWARSEATLARTHLKHYYLQRLGQASFWRKLLTGGVGLGRVLDLGRSVRTSLQAPAQAATPKLPYRMAMARAWADFQGKILLVISEIDLTAKEFLDQAGSAAEWRGLLARPLVSRLDIAGADHTLSGGDAQARFDAGVVEWLRR